MINEKRLRKKVFGHLYFLRDNLKEKNRIAKIIVHDLKKEMFKDIEKILGEEIIKLRKKGAEKNLSYILTKGGDYEREISNFHNLRLWTKEEDLQKIQELML